MIKDIKVGDFYELGKRKWKTWRLSRINNIERIVHPGHPGTKERNFYHYDVLACNDMWYCLPYRRKICFCDGAPIMREIKKVEYNDLPMYLGAPHITKEFEKVFNMPL
jgi:hypothetical protein